MKKIITAIVLVFSTGMLSSQIKINNSKAAAGLPKPGLLNYRKELASGD